MFYIFIPTLKPLKKLQPGYETIICIFTFILSSCFFRVAGMAKPGKLMSSFMAEHLPRLLLQSSPPGWVNR